MARSDRPTFIGLDSPDLEGMPSSLAKVIARKRAQKSLKKDVYERRKDFFRATGGGKNIQEASSGGSSGLSDDDHRKARRVRKGSTRK